jgi:NAD(P)-dependent dehydrogenase (short-subunit alcohol dehydrogenase family)
MIPAEAAKSGNQTIVITGCSSGFGYDLALKLARGGKRVYATMRGPGGRNAEAARALSAVAEAESLDLRVLDLDVTNDASVDAAAGVVAAQSGAADVVVNNAGQMFLGITEAFTAEEFSRQLDINVVGIHRVNRAFLPAMRTRGSGLIMNVSSTAGRTAVPFVGIYHASKWAVEAYSQALRGELASSGVDVVIVEPGPFTTSLFPSSPQPADREGRGASYPTAVHEAQAALGAAFDGLFADPAAPTDPAIVVDAMAELIDMAPGTRPLRTCLGVDFGVRDRNAAIEPFDTGLLEGMGMTAFTTLNARVGDSQGAVTFVFDQAATSPTTFAGTFAASGSVSDSGTTVDELTITSAQGASPIVATFRRTVVGEKGTFVLVGDAVVDLTDLAAAVVSGSWRVELAAGAYAGRTGEGAIIGNADFTLPQPRGQMRYTGHLVEAAGGAAPAAAGPISA